MADNDSDAKPQEETGLESVRSSAKVARILDSCFRIPGTRIRFGLDPILGLIPGGGEAIGSVMGAYIVGDATRNGVPFSLLFRMGGNMLLNAVVGVIPGAGDVFSVWFKSNVRNYRLMQEHLDAAEGETVRGGWWPLLVTVGMLGLIFAINITMWLLIWGTLWKAISSLFQ